jgi:hypothetical protein
VGPEAGLFKQEQIMSEAKKQAYRDLLETVSQALSNNGCNDFTVDNSPEMYQAIEEANAANYNISLEEWKKHEDYYAPSISKDKRYIYTQDYTILAMIEKELGL